MQFVDFCRAHGVVIDYMPPIGIWKRYPTVDKPRHRNGAVKWTGKHGFVQNHAQMQEVAVWTNEEATPVELAKFEAQANKATEERKKKQEAAARYAQQLIEESELSAHPYFERKGFPDERVLVSDGVALIPMRIGSTLVGIQRIDADGNKRFLSGQRTSGAQFVFQGGGTDHILCEGYATGLSVMAALRAMKRPATVHVCFSAGNIPKIASFLGKGIVVADNDESGTGERVAKQVGWKYWLSDRVGEDFNDFHQRTNLFTASQSLSKVLRS